MLHNLRHKPPLKSKRRVPWEDKMTLCMAAITNPRPGQERIAMCADRHTEIPYAGSDSAFKLTWARKGMPALIAGEPSKGLDLMNTFKMYLEATDIPITSETALSALTAASLFYKQKLVSVLFQLKLGITFERFLKSGKKELTESVRTRMLNSLENLDYDCEAIIGAFVGGVPRLFHVESSGEVTEYQNFVAIGTGEVIAKAVLYQREQCSGDGLGATLYNLYEASMLAHRNAPAVGEIDEFTVYSPDKDSPDGIDVYAASPRCLGILQKTFKQVGPKPLIHPPKLDAKCLDRLEDVFAEYYSDEQVAAKLEKERELQERTRKLLKHKPANRTSAKTH